MTTAKIPTTVITGFLGAGKTTMIRNLLQNADGRKIALIINEFGDLGVDGEVLKGCGIESCAEDDIVELTNGCICCTVADDFIPTMTALLAREQRPDHIIIETSGLALPQPLVAAFNWPEIKTQVTVDGVVTVIDAAAVSQGRFAHDHDALDAQRRADDELDHESPLEELFEDQIRAADMIVLNKTDLVDAAALSSVKAQVSGEVDRPLQIVSASHGVLPVDVLLGLDAATENEIAKRKSHHELHHEHHHDHDDDDDHHHHHDHHHDDFESFVVSAGSVSDVDGFIERLRATLTDHDVLRCKGFIDVPGKPMRLVVQAVGSRIDSYYDRPWQAEEQRGTRLVMIGVHGLDRDAIDADVKGAV
ncbi:MAG: cobalamin biosynthesis protein CobW [Pseudomonadota bacterium]